MSRSVENWTQHTCYWACEIWQKGWAVVYSQWSWCARYTTKKRYQQVCCYIFGKLPVHTSCNIKIQILLLLFCLKEGRLAEWSECWTCNSEALEVHARPDRYLDLFSVVPSANLWPRLSKNQLVCLLPVGILNHVMFHLNYLFHNTEYLRWGLSWGRGYSPIKVTVELVGKFQKHPWKVQNLVLWACRKFIYNPKRYRKFYC